MLKPTSTRAGQSETPREILTRHILERGMRRTPERYAVLNVVMAMKGHHTAEEVYEMMPAEFHVSPATVYSALALMVDCGLLYNHRTDGATLYECAYGHEAHHHYICTGCGKISDLRNDAIERAAASSKTPRFKKMRCSTYIYGICNVCQARLAKLKKKIEQKRQSKMTREEIRFARIGEELEKAAEWFR